MLYLFMGKSGSGKTTVAEKIRDDFGLKIAKSYTTRPKRYESEDNHYFITREEMANIKHKIAYVNYNGNEYCYTREELQSTDIFIGEPSAIDSLLLENIDFHVFYFCLSDNECVRRMKVRGDSDKYIAQKVMADNVVFENVIDNIKQKCTYTCIENLGLVKTTALNVYSVINKIQTKGPFRLLTDLDDVLENLCEVWVSLLSWLQRDNSNFVPKNYNEITDWDISKFYPMLTIDEVFEPLNTDLIWKQIKPIKDSVEIIRNYNSMPGVNVRILTASHYSSIASKREFLRTYFPFINWNQLIITSEKKYVHGNVLIDDSQKNLIGGNYKGILFTQPHNEPFDESLYSEIQRANNWKDVKEIVDKMIFDYYNDFA